MMSCITQSDMDKLENQVLQYQIVLFGYRDEYQKRYDASFISGIGHQFVGSSAEKSLLLKMRPADEKWNEARKQRDEFKKFEICEDIEKKKARIAQTVATERIKELEELLKLSGEELKLSEKEFSTAQVKQKTLTDQYIIIIAVIVLIGILFFRRKA